MDSGIRAATTMNSNWPGQSNMLPR
jgi:hypothetical protein